MWTSVIVPFKEFVKISRSSSLRGCPILVGVMAFNRLHEIYSSFNEINSVKFGNEPHSMLSANVKLSNAPLVQSDKLKRRSFQVIDREVKINKVATKVGQVKRITKIAGVVLSFDPKPIQELNAETVIPEGFPNGKKPWTRGDTN
ncbi:hypothetical protein Q3G72_028704 [Acer saccharum]|nr:hypothetical protein Q3G72_028704 [Acer saccharum]